jgi:hypothetical protein
VTATASVIVARRDNSERAAAVASAMRSVDVEPEVRLLDRLPIADSLTAVMAPGQVWLLAADEPNATWIEREAAMPHRSGVVRVERIHPHPDWALGVAARALGRDLAKRRLIVVEDRFAISGRGVVLKPDVPFELLWTTGDVAVELRLPDATTRAVTAQAWLEHVRVVGKILPRPRGLTLMLPDAVPVGTAVWLNG